jgi:copper(I)-binding protein
MLILSFQRKILLLQSLLARATVGGAALAMIAAAAFAHDYDAGPLHIGHPWVRATPPGAPTAAGYLTITNHGASAEHLLGGTAADIGAIEIHEMSMSGQIMRMRPMLGGLAIGPGQTVVLTPGGDRHLMLIGPKHALKAGEQIPATLRFEKDGPVKVVFLVRDVTGPATPPIHPMAMH